MKCVFGKYSSHIDNVLIIIIHCVVFSEKKHGAYLSKKTFPGQVFSFPGLNYQYAQETSQKVKEMCQGVKDICLEVHECVTTYRK